MGGRAKIYEVICPYCGKQAELVDSAVIYQGRSYGWAYLCKCRPDWAYVGCHGKSKRPLGRLADHALRRWKMRAHEALDVLWKNGGPVRRKDAYTWLRRAMGLSAADCHIGLFSVEQCRQVVALCAPLKQEIRYGGKRKKSG